MQLQFVVGPEGYMPIGPVIEQDALYGFLEMCKNAVSGVNFSMRIMNETNLDDRAKTLAGVALYFLDNNGAIANHMVEDVSDFTEEILKEMCKSNFYITVRGVTRLHFSVDKILEFEPTLVAPKGPGIYPTNGRNFYIKYYNDKLN